MGITTLLDAPFYTGTSVTQDVPYKYPVALAGHPYMVDMTSDQTGLRGQYFRRTSVPILRAQADTGNLPDESSLSPDDMWRRSQDSWHLGAGQTHLDRKDSDANRFRSSKGVNVWTKWQASLLPDTVKIRTSANTNLAMVTAGTELFILDGQKLSYSTNPTAASPSFTDATGTPAATPTALTTDGYTVYASYPANLYTMVRGGAAASASSVTQPFTVLAYVKGRLMGANGAAIYNITTLASNPTALFTHSNTDWTWVGFAEGVQQIYAGGYSGDKSIIYRTSVRPDGTALDVPVAAVQLPDGEILRSIVGYLGYVIVASDAGLRLGTPQSDGSLTLGGLIPVTGSRAMQGYDRFVWFGWNNYDTTSTGLGRLDLANFTFTDTPAYASDLMATAQGNILAVVQLSGTHLFAVSGVGFYNTSTNLVASGTIDSGLINYDIADQKVAMFVDVKCQPLNGTITTSLSTDSSATFTTVGTNTTAGSTGPSPQYTAGQVVGESFELRETLAYKSSDHTSGPVLTRHTLRAYPSPARSFEWVVPLLIHEQMSPYGDASYPLGVQAEIDFLCDLVNHRALVAFQYGTQTFQVFVQDVDILPYQLTSDKTAYATTAVVHLKQPSA